MFLLFKSEKMEESQEGSGLQSVTSIIVNIECRFPGLGESELHRLIWFEMNCGATDNRLGRHQLRWT